VPVDLLAGWLPVSRDLPVGMRFTHEQLAAIERRQGDLLLDASAGSGKTSVLVERFVLAVLEDGVDVSAILTITFTEKAAAELRERIRARLRGLGAAQAARDAEGAFISTIHGFCARVLRANALAAGLDPAFVVLDQPEAERLADEAFDDALDELVRNEPGGLDLVAAYMAGALRGSIQGLYSELRSRGELRPSLPALGPAPGDPDELRAELSEAAARVSAELGAIAQPAVRVVQALERLERCATVLAEADPSPAELGAIALPGGNGAALTTEVCQEYGEALARYRRACEHRRAVQIHGLLDRLLAGFGRRYEERKRARSELDFADLELLCRELLRRDPELCERYRARFAHVMVDELQDTNRVQLELIEAVADENLFTVGDAQQSIYGFRHADVELFEQRGESLSHEGARLSLAMNFRTRPEIIEVLNRAFAVALDERFRPLVAARDAEPPADGPLVEMIVADKGADWAVEGLAAPWRLAEARALARRVAALTAGGVRAGEIVVLTRATTDLRAYERALEARGIPTYVIGGRGYWAHPQVLDMVAYLRALANPRDEEAVYTVLASPLLGVSYDTLVLLGAASHGSGRDPWWILREPEGRLDEVPDDDRARLAEFAGWFAAERRVAARAGIEELIERGLERSGYDLTMLAMPGGERRLANVRKLMRLGREYEAASGRDLRGFLELVRARAAGWGGAGDSRESEAPVESETLDAVRLMTIHRAKGLEFGTVCVADLGRGPIRRAPLVRIGRDGGFGIRLAEPGTGRKDNALDYQVLGEEQQRFEEAEERRLFYVAMTRARERLILSGAAKLEEWPVNVGGGPIGWIAPAFVGETDEGVEVTFVRPEDDVDGEGAVVGEEVSADAGGAQPAAAPPPAAAPAPPPAPSVGRLSYSALGEYERCGYRFYVERVLGLPPTQEARVSGAADTGAGLSGTDRGVIAHALLEGIDFRRPVIPAAAAVVEAAARAGIDGPVADADAEEIVALITAFAGSELCVRLGRATDARREERFTFLLGGVLVTGAFDVLAREPGNRLLVVDYKSDRLDGADPASVVSASYLNQRLIYALAGLRAGADEVEVAHVFLEASERVVAARFVRGEAAELERELAALAEGAVTGRFVVTDAPQRSICAGCPAEGGLCSWPLEMTRRDAVDRLF
jgi:ATP-dependent helicase/nuclease subunit A